MGITRSRSAEFIPIPPPPPGEPDLEEELLKNAGPMSQKATNNPPHTVADMNTPAWRRAEIPAGNAHTTARALARVYGALACGVGFGYVMNQMHAGMPPDPRALRLIDALFASL